MLEQPKELHFPGKRTTAFFPHSHTLIHEDRVFDARYVFLLHNSFSPTRAETSWFATIVQTYDAGEIKELNILEIYPSEYTLFIRYIDDGVRVCLSVKLELIQDSYLAHLSKAQRAARRWLMLRRLASRSWLRSIKGWMAFERRASEFPDDVLGKILSLSLAGKKH